MKIGKQLKEYEFSPDTTVARRLAIRMAIFGIIIAVLCFSVLVPLQLKTVKSKTATKAYVIAGTIASLYQVLGQGAQIGKVSQKILEVARLPSVASVGFLDPQGQVLYSRNYLELNAADDSFWSFLKGEQLVYVTHPVNDPKGRITSVLLAMDLSVIYEDYIKFYFELAFCFILAIILLTLFVAWMVRNIVGRRLANLAMSMGSAERGSFLLRGQIDKMDEIGSVTLAFNKLLAAMTNMQVKDIEREQDLNSAKKQLTVTDQLEKTAQELNLSNDNLKRRVKAQELLMDAAHHMGGVLNKEALVSHLVALIRDKLGWPDFVIFLTDSKEGQTNSLKLAVASGLPNIDMIKELTFQFGEGITGLVAQTATPMVIGDLAKEDRIKLWSKLEKYDVLPDFLENGSMLSVPMSFQGRVVGVMDFFYPKLNAFDEEDVSLLHALGALVATSIVNADLYEATVELATSDSLTGVLNRRSLERVLASEVARAQRFSTPLSLLLVDVDHFKNYNDQMGHLLGDKALKEIAGCLQNFVRKVDSVARFGGEEFCIILPQTSGRSAFEVAEKLCTAVRKLSLPGAHKQPMGKMSISIGVAMYPDHMPPILEQPATTELVHAADEALFAAKRKGRDKVVCYDEINLKDKA